MGDDKKKREWKAWGVFLGKDDIHCVKLTPTAAKSTRDNYNSVSSERRFVVRPVTISLAKPKRRAKK